MADATVSYLPKIFRWVFTVLVGVFALATAALCVVLVINPHLPAGLHFGPSAFGLGGQPGTFFVRPVGGDYEFRASVFRGTITFFVGKASGLFETIKHYGLPLALLHMLFLTALFELLRRLFRNVGRGDSFSPGTIRLVQSMAGLLIASSFILAFAQQLFGQAVIGYLLQHAAITVSGTAVRLPAPDARMLTGHHFSFDGAMFCYGLLVLALSEVFRQGLALKNDSALTI